MPALFSNVSLNKMVDPKDIVKSFVELTVKKGTKVDGYNDSYFNYNLSAVQFVVSCNEKTKSLNTLDVHYISDNTWNVEVVGDINCTNEISNGLTKRLMVKPNGSDEELPLYVLNSDLLPSYLPGEKLELQVIAFPEIIKVFEYDEDFRLTTKSTKEVYDDIFADGTINRYDEEDEATTEVDKMQIFFKSKIEKLEKIDVVENNLDIHIMKATINTSVGKLDLVFSPEQVAESNIEDVKEGSIVTGFALISADTMIDEYCNGIIKDEEHNLKLIRNVLHNHSEKDKLSHILKEDTIFNSEIYNETIQGSKEIIDRLDLYDEPNKSNYVTTTNIDSGESKYALLISNDDNDYLLFLELDEDGLVNKMVITNTKPYEYKLIKEFINKKETNNYYA
ncbi:MAG: hypothetical protein K5765_06035 [Clostridia bacterium]|nr:hypothetical protein [Clostridia bacterium]